MISLCLRTDSQGAEIWTIENRSRYDRSTLRYPSDRASVCTASLPATIEAAGQPWQRFAPYLLDCPVHAPGGALDPARRVVGDLAEAFPSDVPNSGYYVTFADWQDGVPWQIDELRMAASALVDTSWIPPMRWDRAAHIYRAPPQAN